MPAEAVTPVGLVRRLAAPMGLSVGVFVLDQATKLLVRGHVDPRETIPIIAGFLNLVHARNPGAAFSFLADAPAWFRAPFFVGITIGAIAVLLYVISRLPVEDRLMRVALGAVLGGALGNLLDRLRYGEVTDFIDVHWRAYHWPAFNVADSSITVAVVMVIVQSLFASRSAPPAAP